MSNVLADVSAEEKGKDPASGLRVGAHEADASELEGLASGIVQTDPGLSYESVCSDVRLDEATIGIPKTGSGAKGSLSEGESRHVLEELAALSSGLACPRDLPSLLNESRELHIPHAHTAAWVPALVATIEEHLQRHASLDRCVIMVESLTPSHTLLSKKAVGEALSCIAQGRSFEATALLEGYASSPGCKEFLQGLDSYDPQRSYGANFLQLCRDNDEYLFALSDALRVSNEELGVEYTIELIDLDSSPEQQAGHQFRAIGNASARELERLLSRPSDPSSDGAILGELLDNARRYIAATACLISPLRNQTMFNQLCGRAESLVECEDTLLVALYGAGHLQVGAQRILHGPKEAGVAIVAPQSSSARDFSESSPFTPKISHSFATSVVANLAAHSQEDRFEKLNVTHRLKLCEAMVSEDQAKRFLWNYLNSELTVQDSLASRQSESALTLHAFMAEPAEISEFLATVGDESRRSGMSWRESANRLLVQLPPG